MTDTILYANYNATTQRSTELLRDEDGQGYIVHAQNTRPIVESAKAIASNFDPHVRRDITHVARIPMVMWLRLVRLGIARDPKALNAWLDSPEARQLRCDDGRKI